MKIITWNCNMAFRKKAAAILAYAPDILVIPECEHPDKLVFPDGVPKPVDSLWFGSNLNKGLGIFSYGSFRLKKIRIHNPDFKLIVPVAVTGGCFDFTLFAIWANNPEDPDGVYVEQVWKAIHHYDKRITRKRTVLAGDFNSNSIWDRKYRVGNHSHVVDRLAKKHIQSVYHLHYRQEHGKEQHPTQYMYRHQDKPYHLDYCFVSRDLSDKITAVEVGAFAHWKHHSDHVPLMVSFDISDNQFI
jgi:exodeoxyribonuclease-3